MPRIVRIIKESGPYRVESNSDGKLSVYPKWPVFVGTGPGLISRMALADEIESLLNSNFLNEVCKRCKKAFVKDEFGADYAYCRRCVPQREPQTMMEIIKENKNE